MNEWMQTLAVAVIGAGALAYLVRQGLRRLRPQAARRPQACGGCQGCSGGGCGPDRR